MLRHSKTASQREDYDTDAVDEQLLAAVEAGLPWRLVLAAVPCAAEEAQARLLRLMHLGIVEDDAQDGAEGAQSSSADDDDPFDSRPTGLLEPPQPSPRATAASGVRETVPALDDATREALVQVDALFERMGGYNYYQLLGVDGDANLDAIRKAYGGMARRFHPDVFFRKPIGESRRKLELIFTSLTRAYEVLRSEEKRTEYDSSIGLVRRPKEPSPNRTVGVFSRSAAPAGGSKHPPPTVQGASRPPAAPASPAVTIQGSPPAPMTSPRPAAAAPRASAPSTMSGHPSAPARGASVPSTMSGHPSAPARGASLPPGASVRPSSGPRPASGTPVTNSSPPMHGRYVSAPPQGARPQVEVVSLPASSQVRPAIRPSMNASPGPQGTSKILREIMARKGVNVSAAPSSPQGTPYARPPEATPDALVQELAASSDQGLRWAATGLREALELERRGELVSAVALLQVIVSRCSDLRVRAQRDRIQALVTRAASVNHRELAVTAQSNKNFSEAAEHWRKVSDADRKDPKSALQAAVCYIHAKEMKQAGTYAKRAAELAPNDVNARRVLLRFYETMGMDLNATRERQALAKLGVK